MFFPTQFPLPPCLGLQAPKLARALDYPSATFQHQGSGYSLWMAKGSLYWFCPIQIPSKCWGWSNLMRRFWPPFGSVQLSSCSSWELPTWSGQLSTTSDYNIALFSSFKLQEWKNNILKSVTILTVDQLKVVFAAVLYYLNVAYYRRPSPSPCQP